MPEDQLIKIIKFLRTGNANYLIDAVVHPQFKGKPEMVILDEALHILKEGKVKPKKFVRYNLKHLIKEMNRRR